MRRSTRTCRRSGRRGPETSRELVAADVQLQIDQFGLRGAAQWDAWVSLLRHSRRVADLQLMPASLAGKDGQWVLTGQWQGMVRGRQSVSPELSMTFGVADERVTTIETRRADYAFVLGASILPQAAFAALLGQLPASAAA